MSVVDNYLHVLQEQFSASVVKSNIHGTFQNEWTDCFNTKCSGIGNETKFEKEYCKTTCILNACNRAIAALNSQKSNCAQATDTKKCLDSLRSEIENYKDKVKKVRDMQDKIAARRAEFRRNAAGA